MQEKRSIPPQQRPYLIAAAALELLLKLLAARDIHNRAPEAIRGPKKLWYAALAVNFFGPVAYFAFGRVRSHASHA
ncbi:MAG: hypothetical protein QM648_01095 [Solirubrobacterales bacterium]